MKSFGQLLQQYSNDYENTQKAIDIATYCTAPERLSELQACCKANGINFNGNDIINFVTRLFRVDPERKSLQNDYNENTVDYQESGVPYKYGVVDYNADNNVDVINKQPIKIDYITKDANSCNCNKPMVRPKCTNDNCQKLSYFGLDFCPWCMKELPKHMPLINTNQITASSNNSVAPILALSEVHRFACTGDKDTMIMMVAGVPTKFNKNDTIVDDDGIKVTYGDVERVKKDIDKYIP